MRRGGVGVGVRGGMGVEGWGGGGGQGRSGQSKCKKAQIKQQSCEYIPGKTRPIKDG